MKTSSENCCVVTTVSHPYSWDTSAGLTLHRRQLLFNLENETMASDEKTTNYLAQEF